MQQLFKIGEVARLYGINIRTLRYYDEIGLLVPVYVDADTHYRYYSSEQFEQLNTIRYLRTQGVPLSEIAVHLRRREPARILDMLRSQQALVEEQCRQLEQTRARLAARVAQIEDALRPELLDRVRIEPRPLRLAAVLRRALRAGDDLELPLRHLERSAHLSPSFFLGKVGLTLSREQFLAGSWQTYDSLFCLVEPGEDPDQDTLQTLPAGPWAMLRFSGTHQDAPNHYPLLRAELERLGRPPVGDAVEFTLVDYGLTEDPGQFVTEIQVPIAPA
ncbi:MULTISPECIES: MerR family transcriptional regulator [unclassified Flavonifractor]|uniref:MerR family transcriptional regulator n=1 Tax=Flavonifractor sp. An92 TaxID=1965666 RepID=UPI0013029C71|nr:MULTISPECIES: MerR family transcriptional regulator [unclassified Flavonifractor]